MIVQSQQFFIYAVMTVPVVAALYFIIMSLRRNLYTGAARIGSSIQYKMAIAFVFVAVLPSLPVVLTSNYHPEPDPVEPGSRQNIERAERRHNHFQRAGRQDDGEHARRAPGDEVPDGQRYAVRRLARGTGISPEYLRGQGYERHRLHVLSRDGTNTLWLVDNAPDDIRTQITRFLQRRPL